ncbi:coagulation factor V [Strigops habroptila]|uniref:coagulation factor V n=1 Tax=Strigops habroptila TaxID=2489341 RepID=UPI0011CF5E25|nr:coagulation factor V [Strigops habroptila]XP_030333640.1 coagulation factor V [Strigops habroptila]XP_030333641.1 coagulation factor V [Strigops habroptila]
MTLHCMRLFLFLLLGSWWPDSEKHMVGAVKVREHYIAAQITSWTYKPEPEEKSRLEHSDPVFKKISYREYEVDFKKEKPANKFAGLLGPTLHAEVGDTLVVHLKNMADKPVSIHPQGTVYSKNAEGSLYDDRTSSVEKRDDAVLPGQVYTYVWDITEEVGPREADLPCLTYAYYSHENMAMDFNSGLIGALIICKKGSLNEDGSQKLFDKEYVLMFGVFDEDKSWQKSTSLKYTINGYTDGTLPDLEACAYDNISLHLIGMSSKPEIFSIHINGQSMEQRQHRVSTVNLLGGASTTVNMTVTEEGKWLISSLVQKHLQAGMHGYLTIRDCGDKEVKKSRLSYKERRMVNSWEYFIAAEEVTWDYAPSIPDSLDRHYKAQHLDNFSNLIGKKYKKAIFRQYTDASFTKRLENPRPKETGILGPVIRAQLHDNVKVVFKNKASRPYSIYFHGVTLSKNAEGADYPPDPTSNDTQSRGVEPGKTYTYKWKIAKTDQPTAQDAQCITRLYHSAVNIERDIASGLIGPLLICKSEALTQKGVQKKADVEQQAMFAVFDENKSWYIEDNINDYCSNPASVKRDDPKFYNSNIMHTINGYVSDSSEILGFCQDSVVQWHFASVGTHDELVSVRISGHSFLYQGKYEDVLNLFPMSGESVTVEMDNVGTWLLASWGSPEMSNGMRLRFRDARCDYEEDDNMFDVVDFTYTKTDKKAVSTSVEDDVQEEVDKDDLDYQGYLASFYSIRSLRKATGDEENQNLTALAWEQYEGTDPMSSEVAAGSGLTAIYSSESTSTSKFLETHITPLPLIETETFQSNHTSVTAEEDLFLADTSDGKADLVFENRSQSNYERDHSNNTAAGEHLLSNGEGQMNVAEEFPSDGNHSKFFSEEQQEESTGTENYNINSKRKKRNSLAIKFYSVQKMNALLNHVRNKNVSFFDKTGASHSVHHAENASEIVGTSQLPSDYDDELEEEETKMENGMHDVNLTLALDLIAGDGSNASSLSEPKLSKDKQADTSLGNISPNSSPALVKNLLEASWPRSGKYSSKMTNEEWNLVSAKGSLGLEANSDKSVGGKLNRHGRNVTAFINKKHMKKFQGFLHLTGENQKGSHMHPTLKGREENKNDTLSTSGSFIKIRRKKKEYPKMTHLMSPRSKKPPKITNSMAEFGRTLFLGETNHTTLPCCTNTTEAPSEANHTHLSRTKHGESLNYTLTPRQFKPSITIGLPQENGEYEYVVEGSYSEETSGGEYEYHYVTFDDPYMTDPKLNINEQRNPDNIAEHYLRSKGNERRYYIAAKEVCWNYAGYKKSTMMNDKTCKDGTMYKVIFQSYTDSTFTTLQDEDEYNEHLGILGPVIRAEVDDVILVHFKNLASRPYSLHAHGLFYEKSSEGSIYDDESTAWFKEDDQVQPNNSYIYVWYANRRSGPVQSGAACRSWIYYSDLNMEKDIHSGLIGPILICQKGTFSKSNNNRTSTRDFFLLFMVFDEEKSWYFDRRSGRPCSEKTQERQQCHKFYAINGITYNLQGLRMYEGELVRWHLLNMGGPKDIHVVNFHGQTFIEQGKPQHQLGTYMLLPGSFRTIEMKPQRPGWWLLDTEVGEYQQAGMQASYLVIEKECKIPMGLASGVILDSQIDASHHIDYWAPKLARLNNSGTYNAWSTVVKKEELAWIQVDFQRQVLLTGIQTQGAKQFLKSLYVQKFFIVYSKDKRKWSTFKGDSSPAQKIFEGNSDAYGVKENIIDPPIIARYIRVYPTEAYNRPTLRMELLGCELDGCSLPLGMENREIKNTQITASSVKTSWFNTWDPSLARLNQEGRMNAWRAKLNNNQQWLQIDLLTVKKITAIATQGVKHMSAENFVKTYVILYSDQGSEWKSYTDGSSSVTKVFLGNENSNGHVKHFFNPPILSRFIRIVPRTWYSGIALRVELYGCDFGGGLTVKRTGSSGSS